MTYKVKGIIKIKMKGNHMNEALTRKDLVNQTGAKYYVIDYLRNCGKLPVIAQSLRKGIPTLFHVDSLKVVRDHLERRYKSN